MLQANGWLRSAAAVAGLLLVSSCGGGGGGGSMPTEPGPTSKTVMVTVADFSFTPKDVSINPGDSVQWVLSGSDLSHTVTAEDGSFNTALNQPGATFTQTFKGGGVTITYHCNTHWKSMGMQGSIAVGSTKPPPPGY